jgi:hypothetical protein
VASDAGINLAARPVRKSGCVPCAGPRPPILPDYFTEGLINVVDSTPPLDHPTHEQAFCSYFFSAAVPALLAVYTSAGIKIIRNSPSILSSMSARCRRTYGRSGLC